jgi:hypothetical protein
VVAGRSRVLLSRGRTNRYAERKTEKKLLIFHTCGIHKSGLEVGTHYGRKERIPELRE